MMKLLEKLLKELLKLWYPRPQFERFDEDIWTEIISLLDARDLASLSCTCWWFCSLVRHRLDDCLIQDIWRKLCLRDLELDVRSPGLPRHCPWVMRYYTSFDGTHYYKFHPSRKHRSWRRVGACIFDAPNLILAYKVPEGQPLAMGVLGNGYYVFPNISRGIWIVDFHFVCCPYCTLFSGCRGNAYELHLRNIKLFSEIDFRSGNMDYETRAEDPYFDYPVYAAILPYGGEDVQAIIENDLDGWDLLPEDTPVLRRSQNMASFTMRQSVPAMIFQFCDMMDDGGQVVAIKARYHFASYCNKFLE